MSNETPNPGAPALFDLKPIGHVESPYKEKFGIPRQSGMVPAASGALILLESYRREEMWRGLAEFSHVWLLWSFHLVSEQQATAVSTVRPPRLGGNQRLGVFATRSPFRPNRIGLSAVKLTTIDTQKGRLGLSGIDLVDGTPVFDVKPYLPYSDAISDAAGGFTDKTSTALHSLPVIYSSQAAEVIKCQSEWQVLLEQTLRADPRPAFQHNGERTYGMALGDFNVLWSTHDNSIQVHEIILSSPR